MSNGMTALLQRFDDLKGAVPEIIAEALTYEAGEILKIAEPITPKDTGALRKSGRVISPPKHAGHNIVARVRWGGAKAPYAAWVHEMPETFNYTTPGTGPQYAMRAARQRLLGSLCVLLFWGEVRLKKRFPATKSRGAANVSIIINGET
jgi:hypothetical protein